MEPKDSERWIAHYGPLAEAGNPDAQLAIGWAYATGRPLPKNLARAEDWFRKASTKLGEVAFFHLMKALSLEDSPRINQVFSEKTEWNLGAIYLIQGGYV